MNATLTISSVIILVAVLLTNIGKLTSVAELLLSYFVHIMGKTQGHSVQYRLPAVSLHNVQC